MGPQTMQASKTLNDDERRQNVWLRRTLDISKREAISSSLMTATGDNFFNAFAVYYHRV
ncbi:MAG: hypothetical protein P8077_01245 [Gammaproteobacteria bacterium]